MIYERGNLEQITVVLKFDAHIHSLLWLIFIQGECSSAVRNAVHDKTTQQQNLTQNGKELISDLISK